MVCSSCGIANEAGRKFCKACGERLMVVCPTCGAANTPDSRFCGECGGRLEAALTRTPPPTTPSR